MQSYMQKRQVEERDRRAVRIASRYRGLVREGFRDPIGEIAHIEDIPVAAVTRHLRLAGQEYAPRNTRVLNRKALIEEVAFFRMMNRGTGEIAEKVGMTQEQLRTNLRNWHALGYHDMDLAWLDQNFMAEHYKQLTPF